MTRISRGAFSFLFLCAGLSAARAQAPDPAAQGSATRGLEQASLADAVLVVDGRPISSAEYGMWLVQTQGEKLAREFALEHWAVDREARRLGIDVPDEAIAAKVDADFVTRIAGAFLGKREDWIKELVRTGRSEDGLRRQREVEYRPALQAAAIAAIDRVVPEHLIEREWQLRHGKNGRQYDVRLIFFKVVVTNPKEGDREAWIAEEARQKKAGLERALEIRARALAGEDFGKLAVEHSMDPETRDRRGASKGKWLRQAGWPNSFLPALEKLAPGDVSEPLYARGGWWLVQLRDVEVTPLEQVRETIASDLHARGPDRSEIEAVQSRLSEGVEVRVLPSLYAPHDEREWPSAFEPALEIDGEPVRRGDYARWILHMRGEPFAPQFVEEWLVRKRAHELGVATDPDEVSARAREHLNWLLQAGNESREAWLVYLTAGGRSEDSFMRELAWRSEIDLLTEKMMLRDRKVTPEAVRARYADAFGADGVRVEVAMIQYPIDLAPPPELSRDELTAFLARKTEEARVRTAELRARIENGEDFAALAREFSVDTSAADGGRLAERFRADAWPENVTAIVGALAPGETSQPISHGSVWLLFKKLSERKASFEEVEAELRRELETLRPQKVESAAWRNALMQQCSYEVLPPMYAR